MGDLIRRAARFGRRLARRVRRPRRSPEVSRKYALWLGPPPRADRALVAASAHISEVLAPEWGQELVAVGTRPSDDDIAASDLVLVEWTGGPGTASPASADAVRDIVDRAVRLGIPALVWDTAHGVDVAPIDVPDAVVIGIDDPARRDLYADRPVELLGPMIQQRSCAPPKGGSADAPPVRVVHRDGDLVPGLDLLRAAASGSAIVTDRPEAAAVVPGVLLAATPDEVEWTEEALRRHAELRVRQAVRSMRAAMGEWSASSRVDAVLAAVGRTGRGAPSVSAVVPTMRPEQLDNVLDFVARQEHPHVQLVLVTHGFTIPGPELSRRAAHRGLEHVVAVAADATITLGACMNLGVQAADGDYVAKMDDDNFYGRHYLSDLLMAFEYTHAQVVGKWTHLAYLSATGAALLRFPGAEHSYRQLVQGGTMVMPREVAVEVGFEDLPRRVDTTFLQKIVAAGGQVYSADRFGFVSYRGVDSSGHTWTVSDMELLAKPSRLLFYGDPRSYADI